MEGRGGASRLRLGVGRDLFRRVQYRMCSRRGAYALPKQIVQGMPDRARGSRVQREACSGLSSC